MITLAALFTGLACLSFGLAVVSLAHRLFGTRLRRPLERIGLGLLLGLGLAPALWTAIVIALGPQSPTVARALLGLLCVSGVPALFGLLRGDAGDAPGDREPREEPWRRGQWALAAGCLWFLGFAQVYAATLPMHLFDPLYHFSYKGKLVHEEGFGTPSWMVVPPELEPHDAIGRPITHPNYPPGIPALHALVAGAGAEYDENATRSLMGLFVLGSAALLWVVLRPRGRTPALFATFAWSSLPLLFYSRLPHNYLVWEPFEPRFVSSLGFEPLELVRSFVALWIGPTAFTEGARRPDGWTLDGAADLPLAALFLAGCIGLWRSSRGSGMASDRADGLLAGLCLGSAALIKNEGLALVALALGAFVAFGLVRRVLPSSAATTGRGSLFDLVSAGVAALIVAAPWLAVRGAIPSIDEDYPRALAAILGLGDPPPGAGVTNNTPTDLAGALERVPVVLLGFGYAFVHVLRWNLTWIAFFALLGWWTLRRPLGLLRHPGLPLLAIVLGSIAAYGLILVVTPWDLAALYGTTIPGRLILHVAPLAILVSVQLAWTTASERGGAAAGRSDGDGANA